MKKITLILILLCGAYAKGFITSQMAVDYIQTHQLQDEKEAEEALSYADTLSNEASPGAVTLYKRLTEPDIDAKIRARAFEKLGYLYFAGKVVEKDGQVAVDNWFESFKLTDPKDTQTIASLLFNLSMLYRNGGTNLRSNPKKAGEYLKKLLSSASKANLDVYKAVANYELGNLANLKNDLEMAIKYYQEAENNIVLPMISAGSSRALGDIYKSKNDLIRAVGYFEKAVKGPDPLQQSLAAKELAFIYFDGTMGVEKNLLKAKTYALLALNTNPYLPKSPQSERYSEGLRALLKLAGYQGTIPIPAKKTRSTPKTLYEKLWEFGRV